MTIDKAEAVAITHQDIPWAAPAKFQVSDAAAKNMVPYRFAATAASAVLEDMAIAPLIAPVVANIRLPKSMLVAVLLEIVIAVVLSFRLTIKL